MSKEWVIDVLSDLRAFAQTNAMPALADQLEEAIVAGATEIGQASAIQAGPDGAETGRLTGTAA